MEFYSLLSLSLSFLLFIHLLLRATSHKRKLPPGPKGLPVIGSLLTIGNRPHESLTKLAKVHGPLMTVQLGLITTVVASSTEMAREILQKNDQAFLGRPIPDAVTAERDYERSIAWISGGPQWRKLRKLCNSQIFTTQRLDALQGLRHQMMDHIVDRLVEASDAQEAIHIGRLVFGTILNLLSKTMFSVDMLDLKSDSIDELKELIWRINRLHELISEVIDRRLKRRGSGSPRCNDFLDVLIDHSEEHGPEEFSRQDIIILLADLFIGGTDTTTTTMEWAMAELLRNPAIMAKAKQELAQTISPKSVLQEQHITQLPYLEAVIKETMRLHPTAPLLLPHRAETDVEVCGYTIPKHTQVLVNFWSVAHDPAYWPDGPGQFVPERFVGSEVDFRGRDMRFIPFGAGRRMCPGLGLGVRMVNLLLANLVHHFDWKLPDGLVPEEMDMKDKFGITLQKAVPLVVIPVHITTS
ncbi:cytochrome P450 76T24-like [Actinidia eriantha]|uniref:cytochrome P450 76T24-like n=1 Tax=Actinidia eriantha TaxID=165200 RepID=UPI00258BBCF4|nr:cytochrome P450 76T24-like [Actinidia eriantha]